MYIATKLVFLISLFYDLNQQFHIFLSLLSRKSNIQDLNTIANYLLYTINKKSEPT